MLILLYNKHSIFIFYITIIYLYFLVTQGIEKQLETHVYRVLIDGLTLTLKEVTEAILQLVPFVELPCVQNAWLWHKKCLNSVHESTVDLILEL